MSTSHQRTPGTDTAPDSVSDPADLLELQASGMRNRMLALWGAEKMGLNGASSESYAVAVLLAAVFAVMLIYSAIMVRDRY